MTATAALPARRGGLSRLVASPFNLLVTVLCAVLALLIVLPLAGTLWRVVAGEDGSLLAAVARVYNADLLPVLGNTVLVVGSGIVAAVVVGTVLAWLNERTDARLGWASDVLPVLSLLVPSIAGAIGWVLLASPDVGYVNVVLQSLGGLVGLEVPDLDIFSVAGMVFVYTLYLVPQVYLVVAAALRNLDPALEEAARVSGRRTLTILRTVTLPAVKPAIISGALLALVLGLAMFSIPLIIGTQAGVPVLTVQIVRMLKVVYPPDLLGAVLLSVMLLVLVLALTAVSRAVTRSGRFATIGGKNTGGAVFRFGRGARLGARALIVAYVLGGCVLPVLALLYVSLQPFWTGRFTTDLRFGAYEEMFAAGSATFDALTNSLVLAVVAASVCMLLAVLVAYQMSISDRFGALLGGLTKLPGTVSHVIFAIALLSVFAGPPLELGGTVVILLLAYVIIYITQATVSAQSAAVQVGRDLTDASLVCGRGSASTLRLVSLPLMAPGIAAGWVFVFVLVVGDITASAVLAGTNSPVIGFTMLELFQHGTYASVAALGTVVTVLSSLVVVSVIVWTNRSRRRTAR